MSIAEQWVEKLAPYGSMIALGIATMFLAFIGITYFVKANFQAKELEWRQLNTSITEVGISGNTDSLKQVAEDFPESKAGLWALQLAGDYDLRTGLSQLSYDREGGLKLIKKARDSLQTVVDASDESKSTMLQRRSTFSLAYANESLGEFEKAKALYQQLIDAAPDTAFAQPAKRGVERTSDSAYVALFDKFTKWEDILGDAPGPMIPERPDISFPSLGEKTGGGGDFGSEDPAESSTETTTSAPAETVSDDDESKSDEDKSLDGDN